MSKVSWFDARPDSEVLRDEPEIIEQEQLVNRFIIVLVEESIAGSGSPSHQILKQVSRV